MKKKSRFFKILLSMSLFAGLLTITACGNEENETKTENSSSSDQAKDTETKAEINSTSINQATVETVSTADQVFDFANNISPSILPAN